MWAVIFHFPCKTNASLIKNESYEQSPEKTQKNGEHEKRHNINT